MTTPTTGLRDFLEIPPCERLEEMNLSVKQARLKAIKVPEIQFHHEVTNQYLRNQFERGRSPGRPTAKDPR